MLDATARGAFDASTSLRNYGFDGRIRARLTAAPRRALLCWGAYMLYFHILAQYLAPWRTLSSQRKRRGPPWPLTPRLQRLSRSVPRLRRQQLERERQQLQQPLPATFDYRAAQQFLDALTGLMGPMEPLLEFAHDNAAQEQLLTYLKATATLEQVEALSRFASRLKTLGTNVLFQAHAAGTFVARKQRLGYDPAGSNIVDFPARQTG